MPNPSDMVSVVSVASAVAWMAALQAQATIDGGRIALWATSEGIGWD